MSFSSIESLAYKNNNKSMMPKVLRYLLAEWPSLYGSQRLLVGDAMS